MTQKIAWILLLISISLCSNAQTIKPEQITLYDSARNRDIPIAIYTKETKKVQKIAIINHGYGANRGGSYLSYSFISESLAAQGYYVVSIQHELPTDELVPSKGNVQQVRMPSWKRGVQNILFVIASLKKSNPNLDYKHLTLIGHSHGGDTIMLLAQQYPDVAHKVISLDNRRMAIPRTEKPQIYSLRSSDQPADDGVIPSEKEQQQYGITVIRLPNTIHNHMDDSASVAQREEINNHINRFIKD